MIAMRVHNASHSSMLLREKKGHGEEETSIFRKSAIQKVVSVSFRLYSVFDQFHTLDTGIFQFFKILYFSVCKSDYLKKQANKQTKQIPSIHDFGHLFLHHCFASPLSFEIWTNKE